MCSPAAIPIATTGLNIGGQALGFLGQKQTADAQVKYQNKAFTQTATAARNNYLQQTTTVNTGLLQDRAAAQQQALQSTIQTAKAEGQATASSADAGITGNSVNELYDDFERINSTNQLTLATNLNWQSAQAQEQLKALRAQAQSQVNSALPQPVAQPSALGTLLQIGTSAVSGFDTYQQRTRTGPYSASQ